MPLFGLPLTNIKVVELILGFLKNILLYLNY